MPSAIGFGRVPEEQHRGLSPSASVRPRRRSRARAGDRCQPDAATSTCVAATAPILPAYVPEAFATLHGSARASTRRQAHPVQFTGARP